MRVTYEIFESSMKSWEALFEEAAAFATKVGPERLISISQSEGHSSNGVVTVWYWASEPGDSNG